MKLTICIHQYFDQYLPRIKGASNETIDSYRDAFTLFLAFSAQHLKVATKELRQLDKNNHPKQSFFLPPHRSISA